MKIPQFKIDNDLKNNQICYLAPDWNLLPSPSLATWVVIPGTSDLEAISNVVWEWVIKKQNERIEDYLMYLNIDLYTELAQAHKSDTYTEFPRL